MKSLAILLVSGLAVFSTVNFSNGANAKLTGSIDNSAQTSQVQDTMVLGRLYFVNIKEGEQPVMTALSLYGDRCGSSDFNNKPASTDGIRSVFELNEWIEFYPQANAGSSIRVMVFTHKADQSFYLHNALDDETPGYALEYDLSKDPDEDIHHWGSFYLHPEEFEPGYYDFVFIYNNQVFATMLTRFFKVDEIAFKSDSELESFIR